MEKSRVDRILDLIDNSLQSSGELSFGSQAVSVEVCPRCNRNSVAYGSNWCTACREWMLEESGVGESSRQEFPIQYDHVEPATDTVWSPEELPFFGVRPWNTPFITTLAVGGPIDGTQISGQYRDLYVAVPEPISWMLESSIADSALAPAPTQVRYILQTYVASWTEFERVFLWVESSIDPADPRVTSVAERVLAPRVWCSNGGIMPCIASGLNPARGDVFVSDLQGAIRLLTNPVENPYIRLLVVVDLGPTIDSEAIGEIINYASHIGCDTRVIER